jgi:glycerol-3-phosphate O-acyltransferase/dihydroxyacetone phosphate acyltransferase
VWAYRIMRWFLRQVVRTFYRQVVAVGLENIPPEGSGPVIFAGNHPNSLIDPLLIVATSGRIVHFAAKDTLFRSRFLRVFLRALGAVPIRRRMDHGEEQKVDNSEAFDALFGVLTAGRCIGIFPEGISHDHAQLSRLKTGAARVAYGVMAQNPALPLRIVPCGLTYIHRRHFRSRVLVQYGPPITIGAAELAAYAADERKAVRDLTADIDAGLRALTINAPDWDTLRVLDAVRRMYQPPKIPLRDRVELARRFSLVYERVKDEPEVASLFARVRDYNRRLRDVGLTDAQLSQPLRPAAVAGRIAWQMWWVLVLLPLAAPGVVVHAPIGMLMVWAGQRWAPRKDVVGTSKLVIGLLLVGIVYVSLLAAAALAFGWRALPLALVLLPLSAYATIRVLERTGSVRRLLARVARTLVLAREVASLRALRAELEAEIVTAVDRFRPQDMQPMYPRARATEAPEPP